MDVDDILRRGLTSTPKYLPIWYRYDKQGVEYFDRCTTEKHYYMYSSEKCLLVDQVQNIVDDVHVPTMLIDLGCGNCEKIRLIIDALLEKQTRVDFIAVDISKELLLDTAAELSRVYGDKINVEPIVAEYGEAIEQLSNFPGNKLITWIGGGFQNQPYKVQVDRIDRLAQIMSDSDRVMMSLDITKNPERIQLAYTDNEGIWETFYKNTLWRLNRDYGSKIDTDKFELEWNFVQNREPSSCSYITVRIKAREHLNFEIPGLNISLNMKKGEYLNLFEGEGTSFKYTLEQIKTIVEAGNQELKKYWVDKNQHVALCWIGKRKGF